MISPVPSQAIPNTFLQCYTCSSPRDPAHSPTFHRLFHDLILAGETSELNAFLSVPELHNFHATSFLAIVWNNTLQICLAIWNCWTACAPLCEITKTVMPDGLAMSFLMSVVRRSQYLCGFVFGIGIIRFMFLETRHVDHLFWFFEIGRKMEQN